MINVNVLCDIQGKNFDPHEFDIDHQFLESRNKRGELNKRGKPYSFGFCQIKSNLNSLDEIKMMNHLLELLNNLDFEIGKHGIEEINILLSVYYEKQCNLEFNPSLLEKIANRNISLLVSCYKVEEGDI